MNPNSYRENVDPNTAVALSIPETAYKYDVSEYFVRKLAKECGAYVQIGGVSRILQDEFDKHFRSFASM